MDIGQKLQSLDSRLAKVERSARLSHAAIDNTSVAVKDGGGNLRGIIGVQADGTTAVTIVNGAAPPQPSAPVVTSVLGGVLAAWDGTFADGSVLPLDWQRVEVHASTATGFTPDPSTLKGTIETPQGAEVVVLTDDPVYVRLLARNTSGTGSTPSDQTGPLGPIPVVADDIEDGIVTTVKLADDAVTQAKVAVAAIGSTELAAGAVLEEKLAANAVTTGKLADQVITETKLADDAVTAAKVAVNAIDAAALQDAAVTAQKIGTAAVTAGKIASGAVLMNTLAGPLADTATQRYADLFRDAAAWAQLSASSGGTWAINTAATDTPSGGGKLIATGDVQVASTALVPQDSDTLYRVMVRARATAQDPSGIAPVYIGVVGVGEDGVTLVNRAGANSNATQHYCCTAGGSLGTADGWKTYVGWIQGHSATGATAPAGPATDPRVPEVTHADVRYLRPMIWLNFGKTTAAVMEVEAVTVEAIRTGVVGSTNLITGSVTAGAIATDAVTAGKVAADAITAREIVAGAIATAELAAGAVTANELAANAVTAGKIAADAVTATTIAAGSVQTAALAADAVAAGKVAADAITAREIAASAVTASEIAANAVTAAKVAAGAITTDKLTVTGGANVLTDPSFEGAYTDSLVAGSAYATRDATKGNGSPSSLKIDATSATAVYRSVALTALPVLPGDQIYLAVDYWVSSDWVGGEVNIHARWEDATGAVLSYSKAVTTSPTRSAWTALSATVTAPANAVTCRARVESGAATAGTVWFDNAAVRPVLAGTQIQDGVITTQKIAALTILAGNIAADAIAAGKIAADAVTAREIAALAVTASEIAANTITAGKLAVGSVDATALAADAITGKTITGGTITGTTITGGVLQTATSGQRIALNESGTNKIVVYNSSGTAIGELSASGLLVKGTNGAIIQLDPSSAFPNLKFINAAGTNSAVINISGTDALLGLNSGQFTSGGQTDWKWRTIMGTAAGNEYWVAERTRDGDTSAYLGGRIFLDNTHGSFGYRSSADSTQDAYFNFTAQLAQLLNGRLELIPVASANPALNVNAGSAHTGNLARLQLNGTDKFTVDKDGNLTTVGTLAAASSSTTSGLSAGSGFTVTNFYAYRFGKVVAIDMYLTRSGTTITATSGNVTPDVAVATLPSGWRPTHATINGAWDDGTSAGGWVVGTDGICTLRTASSDITNGRNLRFHITFIQD